MIRIKDFIKKHPYLSQIIVSLICGLSWAIAMFLFQLVKVPFMPNRRGILAGFRDAFMEIMSIIPMTFFMAAFIFFPIVETVYQILKVIGFIIRDNLNLPTDHDKRVSCIYDMAVLIVGVIYEFIFLELVCDIIFEKDWYYELHNLEKHTPIYSGSILTILIISGMFFVGLVILMLVPSSKRPPLVTVLCISALYLGVIISILFTIQLFGMHVSGKKEGLIYNFEPTWLFLLILPANAIFVTIKYIVLEIKSYTPDENRNYKINNNVFLSKINSLLLDSRKWPVLAFLLAWPLLGILIAVLALFGQAPDSVIKAFTETADYTFSTKIPPQNVFYDEHYLCTVAAGGHEKVVKPIRMGKRHGHDVIVNRQLCVANAFEQILEEKTPRFHRIVRGFYDKYGFPVAKLIKSKYVADFIWLLMKPLEWVFLIVIYLVDVHPEDRIYSQYL